MIQIKQFMTMQQQQLLPWPYAKSLQRAKAASVVLWPMVSALPAPYQSAAAATSAAAAATVAGVS